eukprot:TRINITY_DN9229_c0_g1_i1.p1 TRINITY_DN9229_c0_g1~~TRINITY_DN9229_c0_g1_i1.p1  ORF type:complete len:133 (+),score=32.90 TRINITY_DN9229_c0_g1_i1:313-711(+)
MLSPILDHSFYLDEDMLKELEKRWNVRPYKFVQKVGDAIYIPVGCPHQVKNLSSSIKIAEDFVSAENLDLCVELTDSFRMLPLGHKYHKDKLQSRAILYHAMKDALLGPNNATISAPPPPSSSPSAESLLSS